MAINLDPNVHPRDLAIEAAAREFVPWLNDWKNRHNLVSAEYIFLLTTVIGRHIQAVILAEREGVSGSHKSPDLSGPDGGP